MSRKKVVIVPPEQVQNLLARLALDRDQLATLFELSPSGISKWCDRGRVPETAWTLLKKADKAKSIEPLIDALTALRAPGFAKDGNLQNKHQPTENGNGIDLSGLLLEDLLKELQRRGVAYIMIDAANDLTKKKAVKDGS